MLTEVEKENIASNANMIVNGYAFTRMEDGNIRVVSLHGASHACVIRPNGEMLESNMDDIELAYVIKKWQADRKYMGEDMYAEVL